MNQKDLNDIRSFVYVLSKKSVDYELNPNRDNLNLLKFLTNNFYSCLSKKARDFIRDDIKRILENIRKGLVRITEIENKKENKKPLNIYLLEKQIENLKKGL